MADEEIKTKGKIVENETIKQHLLNERFPVECENLPMEELDVDEKNVALKCINHEEINDDEYNILKTLLARYRKAINEFSPKEAVKNYQEVIKRIETAQELIDIVDSKQEVMMKVPIKGQMYEMEFILEPITDSRALTGLALELDLFKNYTDSDKKLYMKAQRGADLSPEESKIIQKINEDIEKSTEDNQDEVMVHFLANQVKLNETDSHEKMVEFWSKFPVNPRVSIFLKAEELLGLTEAKNFELFPVSK